MFVGYIQLLMGFVSEHRTAWSSSFGLLTDPGRWTSLEAPGHAKPRAGARQSLVGGLATIITKVHDELSQDLYVITKSG